MDVHIDSSYDLHDHYYKCQAAKELSQSLIINTINSVQSSGLNFPIELINIIIPYIYIGLEPELLYLLNLNEYSVYEHTQSPLTMNKMKELFINQTNLPNDLTDIICEYVCINPIS